MKTILIMNQKGGCGKTMLADELIWAMERANLTCNFSDLDAGQGSAQHKKMKFEDAEIEVVDTAGALNKAMLKCIDEADFIIIPTLTGSSDMRPLVRMVDVITKNNINKPVLFVFNRCNRFSLCQDFINWFEKTYPDLKTICIDDTVSIPQAHFMGESVCVYKPNSKGAKHIERIISIVKYELGLKDRRDA